MIQAVGSHVRINILQGLRDVSERGEKVLSRKFGTHVAKETARPAMG